MKKDFQSRSSIPAHPGSRHRYVRVLGRSRRQSARQKDRHSHSNPVAEPRGISACGSACERIFLWLEHVVYTDTRVGTSGILDFYKRVNDIASDASYGAIVIARANLGTVAAVRAAKAKNPDKLIVCTAPEENIQTLAKSADAILAIDTARDAAMMMVEEAHGRGAQVFVYYATGVQQSTPSIKESREAALRRSARSSA